LMRNTVALRPEKWVAQSDETIPLALLSPLHELSPPRWIGPSQALLRRAPERPWGSARYPVVVTSSNFGIDQMLAAFEAKNGCYQAHATAVRAADAIADALNWGPNRVIISNACVSAQLGLIHAQRLLDNDLADEVLVFTFDFLSPFVAGGFHALKILNGDQPQPFADRKSGAIGLGDGLAFAVLSRTASPYRLAAWATHCEFHHMTGNDPSGTGFEVVLGLMREAAAERPVWVKGHGTGTLETGRLEARAAERVFPGAPLVSWKGSLGHTLGSCGLVELAIARVALEEGRSPGTIGAERPFFVSSVQPEPFDVTSLAGVVLLSSAFGGAHAAHLLIRD